MKNKTPTKDKRGRTPYVILFEGPKGLIVGGKVEAFTPEQARTRALELKLVEREAKRAGAVTLVTVPERSMNPVTIQTKTAVVQKEAA